MRDERAQVDLAREAHEADDGAVGALGRERGVVRVLPANDLGEEKVAVLLAQRIALAVEHGDELVKVLLPRRAHAQPRGERGGRADTQHARRRRQGGAHGEGRKQGAQRRRGQGRRWHRACHARHVRHRHEHGAAAGRR